MPHSIRLSALVALPLLLSAPFKSNAQQPANADSVVIITVILPDGQPLRDHAVRVFDESALGTETTDEQGRLHIPLPSGPSQIWINVPGIGYGSTGRFSVSYRSTTVVPMPPLAQYAQVSGTVAPELRASGETVDMGNERPQAPPWPMLPASVQADGSWKLQDVPPGTYYPSLKGGPKPAARVAVQVQPGENVTGVEITPFIPRALPDGNPWMVRTMPITLRGTVTDTSGNPIADAQVTAIIPDPNPPMNFSGPPATALGHPTTLMASTDATGHYTISHVIVRTDGSVISLAATAPGYPVAAAKIETGEDPKATVPADLIIPTQHTALTMRVQQHGQPVAGASVMLIPQFGNSTLNPIYWSGVLSVWTRMNMLTDWNGFPLSHVDGTSGSDGLVRFADLPLGIWEVYATQGQEPKSVETGVLQGIAVQAGQATSYTVTLAALPSGGVSVHASLHGMSITQSALGYVAAADANRNDIRLQALDIIGQPNSGLNYIDGGLWLASLNDGTMVPIRSQNPEQDHEDRVSAEGLFALSPSLPPPAPLMLQEATQSSDLHVVMEDRTGKPVSGTVALTVDPGATYETATTSADGQVVLSDVPAGHYLLSGYSSFVPAPPMFNTAHPVLPPDQTMIGQTMFVPQPLKIGLTTPSQFVLRPQPVGYARIHLNLPPHAKITDYIADLLPGYTHISSGCTWDQKQNDIIVGPCLPGTTIIRIDHGSGHNGFEAVGTVRANIESDHIAEATLTPMPPLVPNDAMLPVSGVVLLHDDQTPAWNARAVLYSPAEEQLTAQEPTDALGRLPNIPDFSAFSPFGYLPSQLAPQMDASLAPVLIVWMPGLTGATIVPYVPGQPLHIVLPPALSVSGRITVAGQPVASDNDSTFHVYAAYQGCGVLDKLLSLDVTTQPDGTFTLHGLTPGTYQVQAARDGIWLSQMQTLTVSDSNPAPLTLDIEAPGIPISLHLTDGHGHSLAGVAATLDTPPGPLATMLWPTTLNADGAGILHLDGLTAGRHTIKVDGKNISFDVPPVAATAAADTPINTAAVVPAVEAKS